MSALWRGRPRADLRVELQLPDDAHDASSLSPVDLSVAPGAKLLVHKGWNSPAGSHGGPQRIELLCAQAPATRWIDGLESTVLSGATAVVRRAAGLQRMRPGELRSKGQHWEQPFFGDGPDGQLAQGIHVFGFVGSEPQAVLCTLACIQPTATGHCPALIAGAKLHAAFVAPPQPGWWAGCVGALAAQPQAAGAGLLLLAVAAVALLLRFRPRPKW